MKAGQVVGVLALGSTAGLLLQRQRVARQRLREPAVARRTKRPELQRELPPWLMGGIVAGAFAGFLWYENSYPLRRRTQSAARRDLRNLAIAALAGITVRIAEKPLTDALTDKVHRRRWGLLKLAPLPPWIEVPAAVLLMDYTMYLWHVLTHKVPMLWRFHRVHHADLDLDMTTAIRFHFGEMLLSVPWRAMQIVTIGVSRLPLSIWQSATIAAILFHHSNSRLPLGLERILSWLFMTPRMHGIHHSIVDAERDSNWATIFSFPDYLHGTRRFDVPQDRITIGVPSIREEGELTIGPLLRMPFTASNQKTQRARPCRHRASQ